jgi:hypothetical protein
LPTEPVTVRFPLSADLETRFGKVIEWHPMEGAASSDVAVIELDENNNTPGDVTVAVFADVRQDLQHDALSCFGVARQDVSGATPEYDQRHVGVRLAGPVSSVVAQVNMLDSSGGSVKRGYSGTGVWSTTHQCLVGIVRAVSSDASAAVSYITPTASLSRAWTGLPFEVRTLPRSFALVWSTSALIFFLITWILFRSTSSSVSVVHPQLAAFAGMHVCVLGAMVVSKLWLRHIDEFVLHRWPSRIPPFVGFDIAGELPARRTLGAITIAVLVAFPTYAQVRFLTKFHTDGHVYIYPQSFGLDRSALDKTKYPCLVGKQLCRHPNADRYKLVAPRPYWNNVYHYGDESHTHTLKSVTFWPWLQPLVVFGLTAAAGLMYWRVIGRTFSRRKRPLHGRA